MSGRIFDRTLLRIVLWVVGLLYVGSLIGLVAWALAVSYAVGKP